MKILHTQTGMGSAAPGKATQISSMRQWTLKNKFKKGKKRKHHAPTKRVQELGDVCTHLPQVIIISVICWCSLILLGSTVGSAVGFCPRGLPRGGGRGTSRAGPVAGMGLLHETVHPATKVRWHEALQQTSTAVGEALHELAFPTEMTWIFHGNIFFWNSKLSMAKHPQLWQKIIFWDI